MQLTYDPDQNIAYLRFREDGREIETVQVSDELNVDMAPDGAIYGIELLNAREQLGAAAARDVPTRPDVKIQVYQDAAAQFRVRVMTPGGETFHGEAAHPTREAALASAARLLIGTGGTAAIDAA